MEVTAAQANHFLDDIRNQVASPAITQVEVGSAKPDLATLLTSKAHGFLNGKTNDHWHSCYHQNAASAASAAVEHSTSEANLLKLLKDTLQTHFLPSETNAIQLALESAALLSLKPAEKQAYIYTRFMLGGEPYEIMVTLPDLPARPVLLSSNSANDEKRLGELAGKKLQRPSTGLEAPPTSGLVAYARPVDDTRRFNAFQALNNASPADQDSATENNEDTFPQSSSVRQILNNSMQQGKLSAVDGQKNTRSPLSAVSVNVGVGKSQDRYGALPALAKLPVQTKLPVPFELKNIDDLFPDLNDEEPSSNQRSTALHF